MSDEPKLAPTPWLAIRFELELKGLPHGFTGISRSTYSLGHTGERVTLSETLVGTTKTIVDFWLEYLESNPEEALAALGEVSHELERLAEVFADARISLNPPDQPTG